MLQLSQQHGAVLLFVVQLQTLEEVLVATHVLLLLDLSVDGEELVQLDLLLSALLGSTHLADEFQSWVQVQGTQSRSDVHGIHRTAAIPIVDGEHELRLCTKLIND